MGDWLLEERRGPPAELCGVDVPTPAARLIEVMAPTRPALVLGSTQPDAVADPDSLARAGVELARRRSGGGAVLLVPGDVVWVDVVVPAGDPLWSDDVGRAFGWLGRAWVGALADLGVDAGVVGGPFRPGGWGRLACFAGRGPGEVLVDGRKVVGVCQRRTREGARFQCALLRRWDPGALVRLLALGSTEREEALTALAPVARGVEVAPEAAVGALLARLP